MAVHQPVNPGPGRRARRPGRRAVAGLALVAVVGAGACGAASAVEPPLALRRAAAETFDEQGGARISLAANDPSDAAVAEVTSLLSLEVDWSESGSSLRAHVGDQVGAEVLGTEERFCARVELEAFAPVADWEPGELDAMRQEAVAAVEAQLGAAMAADVSALLDGEWGCLSFDALQDLQESLPEGAAPGTDPAMLEQFTAALRDAADGLVDPWSVREAGEDADLGRHLVASVEAAALVDALGDFLDAVQQQVGELGALGKLGEDMAGARGELLTDEPWSAALEEALAGASGDVELDTWVDDGELTRARVDLVAAAEALAGEEADEGVSAVLTVDFDSDADLPEVGESAVDLDTLVALVGVGLAGMAAEGGFGSVPSDGGA